MHILIAHNSRIPVSQYGGTERVIWYLGKALVQKGHRVSYLVPHGSFCPFANIISLQPQRPLAEQIPSDVDIVHFHFPPNEPISIPNLFTLHGNISHQNPLPINTVFVSRQHASRFGSTSYVYNGLDWDDYNRPSLENKRTDFHFLGNGAWRVKNLRGAIQVVVATKKERLHVLGANRLNFRMGFRFTYQPRIKFYGMVGGEEKNQLLRASKGLVFPVIWHEPFGLAIIESLYFGCPVFGTPYGSLPELVPKEVGFLSNRATELTQALQHADQYDCRQCHDYATTLFDYQVMAAEYLKCYEKILNGNTLNSTPPQQLIIPPPFLAWET